MVISYYPTSLGSGAGVKFEKQNMKIQGVKFEKRSMKAQGVEFAKKSIRERNLQVQEGTQRGLSHDDEAKGSASKLPRTGDTQGVSVCFSHPPPSSIILPHIHADLQAKGHT